MAEYKKSTSNNSSYTLRLVVTESDTSTTNNTSKITYNLYLDSSYPRFEDWGVTCSLKITGPNSQSVVNYSQTNKNTSMPARYESLLITSGTKTVTHDTTGGGSLSISCSFSTKTSESYLPGSASLSGTYTLSSIPRATDISCSGGIIGNRATITLSRKSTSYYHKLYYKMSGQSSSTLIATGVAASSYPWDIPTSFYSLIPSDRRLSGTLYCYTYSNSACTNQIGDYKTCSVTVSTDESVCKPSVSLTLTTDSNTQSKTGNSTTIIKNYSTVTATSIVTANNNSTINSYNVVNGGVTKSNTTPVNFSEVTSSSFTLTATDSREYPNSVTKTLTMVDYINPDIAFAEQPSMDTDGKLEIKINGNAFNGSFGAVNNTVTCKYYYKLSSASSYTSGTFILTKNGNTYSGTQLITGLTYNKAYNVYCTIVDTLHTTAISTNTVTVSSVPVFDWGKDDFNFNVPVNVNGDLSVRGKTLFDLIYPVDSVYISANSTNPSTLFGGTWERIKDTFLLAAGDIYAAGATGGEASVTLTIDNLASHKHGVGTYEVKGTAGDIMTDVTHGGTSLNNSGAFTWSAAGRRRDYSGIDDNGLRKLSLDAKSGSGFTGSSGATGGGVAHNNMPPYLAVYVWKRTA